MRRILYSLAILLLLPSCVHKELCYDHPHTVSVKVEFDWRDAPEADPDGMCVYFYPVGGGSGTRFDFSGTEGGEVELQVGSYLVLCYNNDTEVAQFYNTDDFGSHGVYTREGNVLEPIYGNAADYSVPRAAGTEEERVVICPDMIWGSNDTEVEIFDAQDNVVTLFPHELVCTYTYEVRNVSNLDHLSQMSGSISGMSGALTLSTEELDDECVTLPFESHSDGVSKVTGKFYTFGHHSSNAKPHNMVFYAVMDNGEKYCYRGGDRLDVTGQVDNAPDQRHVHIIIDGLDLPEPIENGSGFDPSVDDWEVVEGEIIL